MHPLSDQANLLYEAMKEADFPLPDEIVNMEIRSSGDGVVQLIFVCNLTGPMLHKLGAAMQVLAVKARLNER